MIHQIDSLNHNYEQTISQLLSKSDKYKALLDVICLYKTHTLWVGGGFIRTIVWDFLSGYTIDSELGDVDVFYYNPLNILKSEDSYIEYFLSQKSPNVNWSVKNQARMHIHNDDIQYSSLLDALSKFPDTASTVAVRLLDNKDYCLIAPYGYEDLFNLKIKATPYTQKDPHRLRRYHERISSKEWLRKWPLLSISENNKEFQ